MALSSRLIPGKPDLVATLLAFHIVQSGIQILFSLISTPSRTGYTRLLPEAVLSLPRTDSTGSDGDEEDASERHIRSRAREQATVGRKRRTKWRRSVPHFTRPVSMSSLRAMVRDEATRTRPIALPSAPTRRVGLQDFLSLLRKRSRPRSKVRSEADSIEGKAISVPAILPASDPQHRQYLSRQPHVAENLIVREQHPFRRRF